MKNHMMTRRAMRLCLPVLVATLAFAPSGCKRSKNVKVQQTEEEAPRLASIVHTSDPKSASQLAGGFYDIENNAWRWTQRAFAVVLRSPASSAQRGATLKLKFTIPDVVITKLKDVTLTASVNGNALPPETYKTPGEYTYEREVAPSLLTGESVRIDFKLDKAIAPSESDLRELGVVAHSIGLELK
jgi:hypothetical protein